MMDIVRDEAMKRVKIRAVVQFETEVPESWSKAYIEDFYSGMDAEVVSVVDARLSSGIGR